MLKAIETRLWGYRFRSRLEARWAVFFDALGVAWEYEPEGFELPDGRRYLPDFLLPEQKVWVEIKGRKLTQCERETLQSFAMEGECDLVAFCGNIKMPPPPGPSFYSDMTCSELFGPAVWDEPYIWCQCHVCKKIDVTFNGLVNRLSCPCLGDSDGRVDGSKSPLLVSAYRAAISARFEHGESPHRRSSC